MLLAAAHSSNAEEWSYADCVEYARTHNISLQQARLAEETSAYNLEEAKAAWEPTLEFGTTQGVSNYPFTSGNKFGYTSSYGLNAGWTVWNGGQREKTIERDKLQLEIDRLSSDNILRSLETDMLQAYLNILYARESIDIYRSAAELSLAQAERARQLMEAGRISRVDYAQLQAQYEQDCYSLVNAEGTYDTRRLELKQLLELGIDTDLQLLPLDWTDEHVLALLPPIDESYRLALQTDLQLRSLGIEQDANELDVQIARAGKMPKISLSGGIGAGYNAPGGAFGTSLKNSFGENIGVTLSIPILDQKKTSMAVARAKVQQLGTQLEIDRRNTELSQLVENWYVDTRTAQARYRAAGQQLEAAELTAELTGEQFRLGLVNTVELMTAHNNLVDARHSLLQAKYMSILGQKMIQYYREATISLP